MGHETIYLNPHAFSQRKLFLNFAPYLAGGTTLILPDVRDPEFWLRVTCDEKVNEGQVVVPTMSDLVNAVKEGKIDLNDYDLSHLRTMHLGAQPIPTSLFRDMKELFPFRTGNMYGITEGGGAGSVQLYDEDILTKPGPSVAPLSTLKPELLMTMEKMFRW